MDFREVTEFLKDMSKYIITFVIMLLIFVFIVSFQPVAGNSMHPTLQEGNVVAVSKIRSNYKRNNIVVFKNTEGKSFIKRIVGLPGEEVHYLNGYLYINDTPYKETFLDENIKTGNFMFSDICDETKCPNGIIPDNMYLVLGDNRPESEDSRSSSIGLVSKSQIGGKVVLRIWPLNSLGSF